MAVEQGLEGRQQDHEQGGLFTPRQDLERRGQAAGQGEVLRRAAVVLHRRTRPVSGQIEGGLRAAQLLLPIGQLVFQSLALQPMPLPSRELGVINGQFRQRRQASGQMSLVKGRQFAIEHADGPAVTGDVVRGEQQQMLIGRAAG